MQSLPTRILCAMLSMVGAAGLVTFAVGGTAAKIPTTVIATAQTSGALNG